MAKIIRVTNAKRKRRAKVIHITERHREAMGLMKLIDAHGGRLGVFRSYQFRPPASPPFPDQRVQRDQQQ